MRVRLEIDRVIGLADEKLAADDSDVGVSLKAWIDDVRAGRSRCCSAATRLPVIDYSWLRSDLARPSPRDMDPGCMLHAQTFETARPGAPAPHARRTGSLEGPVAISLDDPFNTPAERQKYHVSATPDFPDLTGSVFTDTRQLPTSC